MPHLVRFLIRHALIGCVVAILFSAALFLLDVAGLGTLVRNSSSGPMAVVMLTIALCVTFGSLQMGFAVMLLTERSQGGGGTRVPLVPVRVTVPADGRGVRRLRRPD